MLLFDLDNTLYSPERELFSLIDVRINRYMSEVVGIPAAEVDGLRRRYWAEYGVTLQGLIRHYRVDPEDYLDYVHDVDVASRLDPDGELRLALQQLPQRKAVFTNGCSACATSSRVSSTSASPSISPNPSPPPIIRSSRSWGSTPATAP